MKIKYVFRKPNYPLMGSVEGHFFSAKTAISLSKKLSAIQVRPDGLYNIVDRKGEGWSLHMEKMIISPLALKKKWTKLDVIKMFNNRKNLECGDGAMYSEKSLSAKRYDKIFDDISDLAK